MPLRFEKEIENALGWKPDASEEGLIENLNNDTPNRRLRYRPNS